MPRIKAACSLPAVVQFAADLRRQSFNYTSVAPLARIRVPNDTISHGWMARRRVALGFGGIAGLGLGSQI